MSGGSFNYLCYAETDNIAEKISDMEDMRDALSEKGAEDFAVLTQDFILELRRQEVVRESYLKKLVDVWKAVEWKYSCDIGEDDMQEAFKKARNRHETTL
jgi:hypothetical protein